MTKRILSIILCAALLFGCFGSTGLAAKTVTQSQVELQLESLVKTWEGQIYDGNWHGAIQCKGFADMVYSTLFGVTMIGAYDETDYYYLRKPYDSNTTQVGQLKPGYTLNAAGVAAVKALLSQALPGDYIQMRRPANYGHTVIVLDTDDEGVTMLHANWYKEKQEDGTYKPLVTVDHFTWQELSIMTDGLTLYHYKHYQAETTPPPDSDQTFGDVHTSAWYHPYVEYVHQAGFMNGTGSGKFSPDAPMTRGMVVTVLYRMAKIGVPYTNSFTDVPAGKYYADAVGWGQAAYIVKGYSDATFRPDQPITREQLAEFLYRFARYQGLAGGQSGDLSGFSDAAQISSYAKPAMAWMVGQNIFQGDPGGTLRPLSTANRAEVAKVLAVYSQRPRSSEASANITADAIDTEMTPDGMMQQLVTQLYRYDGVWSLYFKDMETGACAAVNDCPMPAAQWGELYRSFGPNLTEHGFAMTQLHTAEDPGSPDVDLTSTSDFGLLLEELYHSGEMPEALQWSANNPALPDEVRAMGLTGSQPQTENVGLILQDRYVLCIMSYGAEDALTGIEELTRLACSCLGQ